MFEGHDLMVPILCGATLVPMGDLHTRFRGDEHRLQIEIVVQSSGISVLHILVSTFIVQVECSRIDSRLLNEERARMASRFVEIGGQKCRMDLTLLEDCDVRIADGRFNSH